MLTSNTDSGKGWTRLGGLRVVLTILRITIGWHFLYEGVVKIFNPNWSAAPYLQTSVGFLAPFFQWLAATPPVLRFVDFLNAWGLALIGLSLMLGMLTRAMSLFGCALLLMYYLAHPPLIAGDFRFPAEGRYFLVDKNVIELLSLLLFAVVPTRTFAGVNHLLAGWFARLKQKSATRTSPDPTGGRSSMSRRELVGNAASLPILGLFGYGAYKKLQFEKVQGITGATIKLQQVALTDLQGVMPTGTIGNIKISRLIMGNNLIAGIAHARDLIYVNSLIKAYNTDAKVFETIELAEKAGITMMQLITRQYPIFHKYCQLVSSKMQTMCQVFPTEKDLYTDIQKAIDAGANMLYVQGVHAERLLRSGRLDLLGKVLDYIKSQGYAAGIGAHSIETLIQAEKAGFNPDYYVKTLHHDRYWSAHPRENRREFSVNSDYSSDHNSYHNNMFDLFPERTIEFMGHVKKPWVAFKVLAGGAIQPKEGFQFAFENGADFICVGMFDFQIVQDANLAMEVLSKCSRRVRPWLA